MPIEVFTGLPGNGKTAFAVEKLLQESEKENPRPLVACGIDGLQPGLAQVLDDPTRWNDVDEHGRHIVPDGALIFVDEAWKWFGHLQNASRQQTPGHVLALAEHRHRGLDFVLITQHPCQIYPFARNMIAGHHHHVRRFGTSFVDVFTWQELNDDPKSTAARDAAQKSTRTLPKKAFGLYKSASEHTIKRKIPLKVFALPVLFVAAAVLLWVAFAALRPDTGNAQASEKAPESGSPDQALTATAAPRDKTGPRWATTDDYLRDHTPRIPTIPGSAPAWDGRRVTTNPELYCMASSSGLDANGQHAPGTCKCVTEQGTPYTLPDNACRMLARDGGPYNPYREDRRSERNDVASRDDRSQGTGHADRSIGGSVMSAPQIGAYGDLSVPGAP